MSDTEKKYDVFISYPREAAEHLEGLLSLFNQWGVHYFVDRVNLGAGRFWPQIERGIYESKVFVLIWTNDTVDSEGCLSEMALAQKKRIEILPVCFDDPDLVAELGEYALVVGFNNRVNYYAGDDAASEADLRRMLESQGITLRDRAPLPVSAPSAPPEEPETSPAPCVDVAAAIDALVPSDVSDFFRLGSETADGRHLDAVIQALGCERFEDALVAARDAVHEQLAFHELRALYLAALVQGSRTRDGALLLQAGSALAALRESPDLWPRPLPDSPADLRARTLVHAAELLSRECTRLGETRVDLPLKDELRAESESAECLRAHGGVGLEVTQGRLASVAFGHRFARELGATRNLLARARGAVGEANAARFFSPAWWVDYLTRHGRHHELLRDSDRWRPLARDPDVARKLTDAVVIELRESLDPPRLYETRARVDAVVRTLRALSAVDPTACDVVAGELRGILVQAVDAIGSQTLTPYLATRLEILYSEAERACAGIGPKPRSQLRRALLTHQARFLFDENKPVETLGMLDEARRQDVVLSPANRVLEIEAALAAHARDGGGLLDRAEEALRALAREHPTVPEMPALEARVREERDVTSRARELHTSAGPVDYTEARETYRIEPSARHRTALLAAVREEARCRMRAGGATAVLGLVSELRAAHPEVRELATLPLELSRAWLDTFPADDLLALVAGRPQPSPGPVRVVAKSSETK